MRGDFSQIRFDRRKSYTAVLEQQGRVALDADANEQCLIDAYQARAGTVDAVGQYGGPVADAGFQITVAGNEILIGPGRYYVDGLLCENPASLSYDNQPYLSVPVTEPNAAALIAGLNAAGGASVIQVWLQVWQRLQTALDDPGLREPALGSADTTARLQTVWRAVASLVPAPPPPSGSTSPAPSCCQDMYAAATPQASTGTMAAGTSGPAADCGCGPVASAGYQGIENQLYRVEIHAGGDDTQATFKWSRENGSVVTAITAISGSSVTVSSLGPDANLGFQVGQWVELTDDTLQFAPTPNLPGTLYQIQSIQQADLSVTLAVPTGQAISVNPSQNARMRRWDQSGPAATADGVPLSAGTWIQLENGIQVMFDLPGSGHGPVLTGPPVHGGHGPVQIDPPATFQSGDYWTIPARTATGQIEWPPSGSDGNPAQPPSRVQVCGAPLACVHSAPSGQTSSILVEDCRRLFSPLTTIAPPTTIEAIHVTSVSWVNDDVVTLDALVSSGLAITLDQAPTCPLSGANVIVTAEPAQAAAVDNINLPLNPGDIRGPGPTNLRTVTVIDTTVALNGTAITWQIPMSTELQWILVANLNTYLYQGAPAQQWAKVRIRLLGQMIYAAGTAGLVYLDGRALGQPGVRNDGTTPRIGLQLPSGAGVAASDLEGWLYVAPILQVTAVSINFPAVTVALGRFNQVIGVTSGGTTVSPVAEITVNYPAIADATVTISLTGTSGVGNIVSLPGTTTILRGQTSIPVPISVVGNPGAGTTLTFTISALVTPLIGGPVPASATFSVTGVPPTIIITTTAINPVIE